MSAFEEGGRRVWLMLTNVEEVRKGGVSQLLTIVDEGGRLSEPKPGG